MFPAPAAFPAGAPAATAFSRFSASAAAAVCRRLCPRPPRGQVINYEMPRQAATYVHRVGRTARAGRGGRSVTLIGEQRRLVMKEVLRGMEAEQRGHIKTRAVAPAVVEHFRAKVRDLEPDVAGLLADEVTGSAAGSRARPGTLGQTQRMKEEKKNSLGATVQRVEGQARARARRWRGPRGPS